MKLIKNTSWIDLASFVFDPGLNPAVVFEEKSSPEVIYCPLDHIHVLFDWLKRNPIPCVVISANSDYGFVYNTPHLVSNDMRKWLNFVDMQSLKGYQPFVQPPRCEVENCKLSDRYAVKMYSWTRATVDSIPSCVTKWYCTNNVVNDPRIVPIPFGIPEWSYNQIMSLQGQQIEKKCQIFNCLSPNTLERADWISYCIKHDITVHGDLSHEEYINTLAESKYCISLPGNGLDCYRNLEAIYLGVPLIYPTNGKPVYPYDRLYNDYTLFEVPEFEGLQSIVSIDVDEKMYLDYWEAKIKSEFYSLTNEKGLV